MRETRTAEVAFVADTDSRCRVRPHTDEREHQMLMINLVRPLPTDDELTWKKGVRQSNLVKEHRGHHGRRGVRFFLEDADLFELEPLLIALCFMETSSAWLPYKPWERPGNDGFTVTDMKMLSDDVRKLIAKLHDGMM